MTETLARNQHVQLSLAPGVLATTNGLRMPDHLEYAVWEDVGRKLGRLSGLTLWCIADWLVHGQFDYGHTYEEALGLTGFSYQTCMNLKSTADRVDFSRRRENLSFGHHEVVAALDAEAQTTWLVRAESEGLSVMALRDAIRANRREVPASTIEQVRLRLVLPVERVDRWRTAAERADLNFEEWVARTLDEAAA